MSKLYYNKRTTILSELILINNNLNYINKNYDKSKKIYKKLFKKTRNISRYIQNNEIDNSKIYRYHGYKYKLSNDTDIVLKNRYLDKYNYYISKSLLSKDLLDAGFYEYEFKLKQYLSKCGLNRTTQIYGTCWFNCVLNGILFGHMKNKFIKIIDNYKQTIGKKEFNKIIQKTLKEKFKLDENIKNKKEHIFNHIISIINKVTCQEGLRNTNVSYNNFNLTNLAISLKYLYTEDITKINIKNVDEIAYVPMLGINDLIYIFNNYVDKNPSLKYNTRNNGDKYLYLDNTNNINIMYLELTKEYNYLYFDNYNFSFDNIKINYNNRKLKFRPGHKLYSMDNIDFVLISYARLHHEDIDKQIPEKISIDFDNETFTYNIDHAIIRIYDDEHSHVVTGFICNNNYYIYDSAYNFYYEANWLDLTDDSNESIVNLSKIYSSDYIVKGKQVFLYDESTMVDKHIEYCYIVYYNSKSDYSIDNIDCKPERKYNNKK